jgi:hypothetical protein
VRDGARQPTKALVELIDANAPLWAGEAEVFRTYWDWAGRTRATDLQWLARQCYKELFDGFVPRLDQLQSDFPRIERQLDRRTLLEGAEAVYDELAHYCAFADAYDEIRTGGASLDFDVLRSSGNWPENAELGSLRAEHRRRYGDIGVRAQAFTEGGYCTLYREGMQLRGRGGADDAIAAACSVVYDDEWDHMLTGIVGLEDQGLEQAAWDLLLALSVEQMRSRVRMRNAQFGRPLPEERLAEIDAGRIDPLPFDYARAGLRCP